MIKNKMLLELKLLEGANIYFCFNLKGDYFNVKQLKDAAKTNQMSKTKCLALFYGQSMVLKIALKS